MRNDLPEDISSIKSDVRRQVEKKRAGLDPLRHKEFSIKISRRLFALEEYLKASNIFIYYPYRSEIDTRIIINRSLEDDKNIILPRVSGKSLELFYVKDMVHDLQEGSFGIMEPIPKKAVLARISDIDLAIVPGLAFDKSLNRIGYGGGFYDRVLERIKKDTPRIALCFELQMIEDVPIDTHDKKVDIIITEKGIYR